MGNTEDGIGAMSTPTLGARTRSFQAEVEDPSNSITQRMLALIEQNTRLRLNLLFITQTLQNIQNIIESPEARPTPKTNVLISIFFADLYLKVSFGHEFECVANHDDNDIFGETWC